MIDQGDIWLLEEPDAKPRPCLVLTRASATAVLTTLLIAPLTRQVRGLPTEVGFGPGDGIRVESVASFDNVTAVRRVHLTQRLGQIAPGRWHEVCAAMSSAIGC